MEYTIVAHAVHEYIRLNNKSPFFISDWDSANDLVCRPKNILEESLKKSIANLDKYFFIEDSFGKDTIINFFNNSHMCLNQNSFLIGPNASLMITTALIALKDIGIKNILIVLPVYFSIPQILRILDIKYYKYNTAFPRYQLDFENIKKILQETSADAIIITDPFYGSGINVPLIFYEKLINYLNERNIYLLIDYARGGSKWDCNTKMSIFNFDLYNIVNKANKYIFIDSISKRIFINGFKSSLLFSNLEVIQKIRKLGDCFIGSISAGQMEFINHLYNISNTASINKMIRENVLKAQNHFELIKTLLLGSDIIYTEPTDGNYTLLGIPKIHFNNTNDISIFYEILNNFDIYTLPQSLYTYEDSKYYIFRVNLLLEVDKLFLALHKLLFS